MIAHVVEEVRRHGEVPRPHRDVTTATLSCFDRLLFKGHLPLGYPHGMEDFLNHQGILFKQLRGSSCSKPSASRFTPGPSPRTLVGPEYFEAPVRKDLRAREIAARDGISEGFVCVFATIEACRSFRLAFQRGRPAIRPARRKCLFLYFCFIDRQFGFLHVRLQTWFPFTIQVYVNGHEWLARQMDKRGLRYRRLENAFVWLEDAPDNRRVVDGRYHRHPAGGGRARRPWWHHEDVVGPEHIRVNACRDRRARERLVHVNGSAPRRGPGATSALGAAL